MRPNIAGGVNKLFVFKSLLTTPSNVLPLHLKQTFPPIIWIFTEGEGDGIKSRLPFKIFSTLTRQDKVITKQFSSMAIWEIRESVCQSCNYLYFFMSKAMVLKLDLKEFRISVAPYVNILFCFNWILQLWWISPNFKNYYEQNCFMTWVLD